MLVSGEIAVDAIHPLRAVRTTTDAGEARTSNGRYGVRIREDKTCVTCFIGNVTVTAGQHRQTELSTAQQVVIGGASEGKVETVDPHRADAWRRGELVFVDQPLGKVVEEINRYRPGRIILNNPRLAVISVNAVFRIDSMERALTHIRLVSNASVTSLPGGVVILS